MRFGSVGSRIRVGVVAPEHVLPQLGAHGLHLVLGQLGPLGVEEGAAILVLRNPAAGEHAVLNVGEDGLHVLLCLLIGQDAGAGDILAELGGVGDGVVHHGHAALVDQVDDELHLVDALEVGVLGGVARLDEGLEAQLHQLHHAAAQDSLLAKQVGLGLVLEGGLHHAAPGAADACGIGQSQLIGVAGGVLLHGDEAGHALARHVLAAHGVSGALGGDHADVHPGGGHDLLEMDVEAVGEHQHIARLDWGRSPADRPPPEPRRLPES